MNADDRIPIETAHQILATFGITRPTRAYERWVKEDGFDVRDFADVLFESPYVLIIDWRAWLQDELETIAKALELLEVKLAWELDEAGDEGYVTCGEGQRRPVTYRPNDASEFDNVILAIQLLAPASIEFRTSPDNHLSDTWNYAVLPRDEWADLERTAFETIRHFFVPFDR